MNAMRWESLGAIPDVANYTNNIFKLLKACYVKVVVEHCSKVSVMMEDHFVTWIFLFCSLCSLCLDCLIQSFCPRHRNTNPLQNAAQAPLSFCLLILTSTRWICPLPSLFSERALLKAFVIVPEAPDFTTSLCVSSFTQQINLSLRQRQLQVCVA